MPFRPFGPLLALSLVAPAAMAQDAASVASDPAGAVETFLTDATLFGAERATIGEVSLAAGTVTARDAEITWSVTLETSSPGPVTLDATLALPELVVTNLTSGNGRYSFGAIDVPEARLAITATGGERPLVYETTLTGYSLRNAAFLPFPDIPADPDRPVSRFGPLFDWLASMTYSGGGIEEIAFSASGDGDGEPTTFNYGAFIFASMENGVIERIERAGGRWDLPVAPRDDGAASAPDPSALLTGGFITTGPSVVEDIDFKPLAALLTGTGARSGVAQIVGPSSVDAFAMELDDGVMTVRASLEAAHGTSITADLSYAPILPHLDTLVRLLVDEAPEEEIGRAALEAYMRFSYALGGQAAFENMRVLADDFELTLAAMTSTTGGGQRPSSFALTGLDTSFEGGEIEIGEFAIDDIVLPPIEDYLELLTMGENDTQPDPMAVLRGFPTVGRIAVSDVAGRGPFGALEFDLFELSLGDYRGVIPTQNALRLDNFSMAADVIPDPQTRGILAALGADPVTASLALDLNYEDEGGRIALTGNAEVESVGALDLAATMAGIPPAVIENPARAQEALATAALGGLSVGFEDAGVTPFVIGMMSEQANIPPAAFAEAFAAQIGMQLAAAAGDAPVVAEVTDALRAFLTEPRSLRIEAAPPGPVPLAQLVGAAMTAPAAIADIVNLSVSANE